MIQSVACRDTEHLFTAEKSRRWSALVDYHCPLFITWHVTEMKAAITPGEILLEEYLKPLGISQNAMARAVCVPPRAINEIVLGKRAITPPMSIRFGAFFGQSETFWHGIQVECDFRVLSKEKKNLIKGIITSRELLKAQ